MINCHSVSHPVIFCGQKSLEVSDPTPLPPKGFSKVKQIQLFKENLTQGENWICGSKPTKDKYMAFKQDRTILAWSLFPPYDWMCSHKASTCPLQNKHWSPRARPEIRQKSTASHIFPQGAAGNSWGRGALLLKSYRHPMTEWSVDLFP